MAQLKMQQLNECQIDQFQQYVWDFYKKQGRAFAWRHVDDPYLVLVSEIMLQQTQTDRVAIKYDQFLSIFPTIHALAQASLKDVLSVWKGLGYNRRGMYLHQIAQRVVHEHAGIIPQDPHILQTFPGLGHATARSICAFAYNLPVVFIETNIRAVFIACFFAQHDAVADKDIMPLVEQTLAHDAARDWYYALMDLGVYFKRTMINPSRKSAHYIKQSTFKGSLRQMRGKIIGLLTQHTLLENDALMIHLEHDARIIPALDALVRDGLIMRTDRGFSIKN